MIKICFLHFVLPIGLLVTDLQAQFIEKSNLFGVNHMYTELGSGAGLSLVDFNGDGLDDLSLATGKDQPLALFVQVQGGFVPYYQEQLVAIEDAVRSIIWVDYDNDGDKDLFLTVLEVNSPSDIVGSVVLMQQEFDGSFTDVTVESGLTPEQILPYGCSWSDYDNDGHLDLYICNYSVQEGGVSYLFHNLGDGTFQNTAGDQEVEDAQGASFASSFFDADLDGDMELFVANDRLMTHNNFYSNGPVGTFNNITSESGLMAFMDAMGIEIGDYDADGDLDIYVTNADTPSLAPYIGNTLFRNESDMQFSSLINYPFDVNTGTFWGCSFFDFDFDRDLDLFTVSSIRSSTGPAKTLFVNDSLGSYSAYTGTEFLEEDGVYFGLAQGDVDNDGFIDLVTLQSFVGQSEIWVGPETDNGWIRIQLEGTESNRDGIGAVIEVWADGIKRIDQTSASNSYCSQDSDTYPFGLGASMLADSVLVKWPSGIINTVLEVPSEATIEIIENADQEVIDCIPSGIIQYEIEEGFDQVFYIENASNVDSVLWYSGNSFLGTGDTLGFEFSEVGDFDICAVLYSVCTEIEICDSITITCPEPIALFEFVLDELMISTINLSAEESVQWIINGVVQSSAEEFDYIFDQPGNYELCLVVTNDCGADTICELLDVTCTISAPIIEWESATNLTLSAEVEGNYDSIVWYPGDGSLVTVDVLEHTYELAGEYELCVLVTDLCGSDSACVEIEVDCPLPFAFFDWIQDGQLVLVSNESDDFETIFWSLNNDPLGGEEVESIVVDTAGVYQLCIEAVNDCGLDIFCDSIFVQGPDYIIENQSLGQLSASPNPSESYVEISFTSPRHEEIELIILDLMGRELSSTIYFKSSSRFETIIDISEFPKAAYVIRLKSGYGPLHGILLIKE